MKDNEIEQAERITRLAREILTEEINTVNLIINEKGVAACGYRDVIKDVVTYCQQYINENKPQDGKWHIIIPKSYTQRFGFFKELLLIVNITDKQKQVVNFSGGGYTYMKPFDQTKIGNGMFLEPQKITIEAYSDGKYLYQNTLYNSLYHELNHKIEELRWNCKKNTNNRHKDVYNQTTDIENIFKQPLFKDEEWANLFRTIIYRLFSTTELNALAAGVYGDLSGIQSNRGNFSNDVKRTQAWYLYEYIRDRLPAIEYLKPEAYGKIKKRLLNTSMSFGGKNISDEDYKRRFITVTKERLKDLYKRISRVAAYYYDVTEDEAISEMKKIFEKLGDDYGKTKIYN